MIMLPTVINAQDLNTQNNIKALHFLEGDWTVDNLILKDEKWKSFGITRAEFKLELKGQFVREKVDYLTNNGELNMITYIGYDDRINRFKLSNLAAGYGNMDIYFGEWAGKDLVFTNLESDMPFKLEDGKELSFKLTYTNISSVGFTHIVEGTLDKGKTWFYFSKAMYSKK